MITFSGKHRTKSVFPHQDQQGLWLQKGLLSVLFMGRMRILKQRDLSYLFLLRKSDTVLSARRFIIDSGSFLKNGRYLATETFFSGHQGFFSEKLKRHSLRTSAMLLFVLVS